MLLWDESGVMDVEHCVLFAAELRAAFFPITIRKFGTSLPKRERHNLRQVETKSIETVLLLYDDHHLMSSEVVIK